MSRIFIPSPEHIQDASYKRVVNPPAAAEHAWRQRIAQIRSTSQKTNSLPAPGPSMDGLLLGQKPIAG